MPDLSPRPRSTPLLLLLGLLAFVSLVLEYGMSVTGWASRALVVLEVSIAVGFGLEFLVGLWRSSNRRRFLRVHWFEALLLALLLTSLGGLGYAAGEDGAGGPLGIRVQSLPKIYLALVQVYLLGGALSRVLSAHELLLERQLRPETLLVGGFLALVLIGTALLMLPRVAVAERFSFLDALFTATSAVCVTGLSVRDIGLEMTPLGQGVLLSLFQVGGLGIGRDSVGSVDRFVEGREHAKSLTERKYAIAPGVLHQCRPPTGEIAHRAIAEPAATRVDVHALGDGELGTGSSDEGTEVGWCRDRRRIGQPP